ncbi:hypothetical protein G7Z17_g3925 [Cylindrodendrum hubeiense]|uniref:D-arabinono-1,4-lactone oxidase n=1 Tax=Cylindrodendrum hubeiense TaxID=595255 RepID=A0A9P5LAD4_9HYPO|nr:hypothetical protein G7Z17_g3925 [Cylindrodendrum hubeiense]
MGFSDLSPRDLVQQLHQDPSNDVLAECAKRITNPDTEFETRNELIKHFGTSVDATQHSWSNCIGGETCHPTEILCPRSLNDLLSAVKTAQSNKSTMRAVGSGHSFSDVSPTDGILLDPHKMNQVLKIDTTVLKDPSSVSGLVSVESGITIANLNSYLDSQDVALANMGAYDGQTLAGAISTGTHGTGVTFGPIASSVRALVLVSSDGTVYQIEPSKGITDPAKFASSSNPYKVQLKQDDDWFNTTLVAMGCTGLIYSYMIGVVPAFHLQEFRKAYTWDELKAGLNEGASSSVLMKHRGYEINMNPYADENGVRKCIQVTHDETSLAACGNRGILNWLGGIISTIPGAEAILVWALNKWPGKSLAVINDAIGALVTPRKELNGYIDKSFKVLDVGSAVNSLKAYAMELSMPCDKSLVANVEKLLDVLAEQAKKNQYLAGPLNLRFVAESNAYLAPQANRVTCMVEMDTLVGIKTSQTLLKDYVKTKMCTPGSGIRVHWGLDLNTVTEADVRDMYPDFPKWFAIYKTLNGDGMWNNNFTNRIGISIIKE